MLRVSDSKLYSIRQQVVRQVPLPEEMTVQLDGARLQDLLYTIENAGEGEDFDLFVARLPRRQLNDLFGLLLVIESVTGDPGNGRSADDTGDAMNPVEMPVLNASSTAVNPVASSDTNANPARSANAAPNPAAGLRSTLASFFRQAKAVNAPVITPADSQSSNRAASAGTAASLGSSYTPGVSQYVTNGVYVPEDARRIKEHIYRILERRATPTLAQTGWVFYQQHFFHVELAEAMSRLCRTLVAKGENELFLQLCQHFGSGEELPAKIAAMWIEDLNRPINVLNNAWTLSRQLADLGVVDGSRFATILLHDFFTRAPVERIAAEAPLFGNCLESATVEEQTRMLTALYGDYRMEPAFTLVNRTVLGIFGQPRKGNANPVWGQVSQQVRQHFRQWAMIDMLNHHIDGQTRKQSFYQPLLMRLFDCTQLSPDVLLLEFPLLYIVDHKDFSHQVIFYDRPTLEMALEGKTSPEDLAIPKGMITLARDAILGQKRVNMALLKLEEVNLLYARDFIEGMMNPNQRGSVI